MHLWFAWYVCLKPEGWGNDIYAQSPRAEGTIYIKQIPHAHVTTTTCVVVIYIQSIVLKNKQFSSVTLSSVVVHTIHQYCTLWDMHTKQYTVKPPSNRPANFGTILLLYRVTEVVLFKLYCHGSVGTTGLVLYTKFKCISCPLRVVPHINYICNSSDDHNVCSYTIMLINVIK